MNTWMERVEVVLCRPQGSLNIGACCRAMKTMGLKNLVLVAPSALCDEEVIKMAIHAEDVYEQAQRYESLDEALMGTVLSAGITRRRGVRRKWFSLLPEELADRAAENISGKTALVFGNERTGLTDKELDCCSMACHIPASPDFPSLNLSHAVQVVAATFWRRAADSKPGRYTPVQRTEVDRLVRVIHESLDAMGYFKAADRFHTDRYFRDIFTRAALGKREAAQMEKIFLKLQYLKKPVDLPSS